MARLEILDSEEDGGFDDHDDHEQQHHPHLQVPAPHDDSPAALQAPNTEEHIPTSGELRQRAIEAAHKALIEIEPTVPETVTDVGRERDIYDIDLADANDEAPKKQPRRATTTPPDDDEGSDFEAGSSAKRNKRRRTGTLPDDDDGSSAKKRRATTTTEKPQRSKTLGAEEEEDDEYTPAAAQPTPSKGRKSTRSNTDHQELLPMLPKPQRRKKTRDLTKELQDFLPLPEKERAFVIDMTHDDLVLAAQRKQEYDKLSAATTTGFEEGEEGSQFFGSTIPDPPEIYMTIDPSSSLLIQEPEQQIPPQPPEAHPKPQKRSRAETAESGHNMGYRIASEWRAAKAKGQQTLSDKPVLFVDNDSNTVRDDQKTAPPRKKEPATRRKSKKGNDDVVLDTPPQATEDTTTVSHGTDAEALPPPARKPTVKPKLNPSKDGHEIPTPAIFSSSRPPHRTKSRFYVMNPDGDLDASPPPAPEPAPAPEPKETPKATKYKPTRKSSKKIVDDNDEYGDAYNDGKEPLEKPKVTQTKRKRTKTVGDHNDEAIEVAPQKQKPTPAKSKRTKTAIAVEVVAEAGAKGNDRSGENEPAEKQKKTLAQGGKRTKTDATPPPNTKRMPTTKKKEEEAGKEVVGEEVTPTPTTKKKEQDEEENAPVTEVTTPQLSPPPKLLKIAEKGSHSPIRRSGKIPHRVGLSKRARIEPLLSVRPRERKRS